MWYLIAALSGVVVGALLAIRLPPPWFRKWSKSRW